MAGPRLVVELEGPPEPPCWYRVRVRARDESGFGSGGWEHWFFQSLDARQRFLRLWGWDCEMTPVPGDQTPGPHDRIWEG